VRKSTLHVPRSRYPLTRWRMQVESPMPSVVFRLMHTGRAFTLSAQAEARIAYNRRRGSGRKIAGVAGLAIHPVHEVLIEESLVGVERMKEFEIGVLASTRADNCV